MKEFWDKHKTDIGLAVLVIYTLSLGVATADEVFHLGLFPTKLERLIDQDIERFGSANQADRDAAYEELVLYGDFAVPQLIKALDQSGQIQELSLKTLKTISGLSLTTPEQWKAWYEQHRNEF